MAARKQDIGTVVRIDVPLLLAVEQPSGCRLDVQLSRAESTTFHRVGLALATSGIRLRDGTVIDQGRSFRTNVLRWLMEQVENSISGGS